MITKIDHIAVASHDINSAQHLFNRLLGLSLRTTETVEDQEITTDIYDINGIGLEVMEPMQETSPITKFLEKRGPGIHHICFQVTEIEQMLQDLESAGIKLIDREPRIGAEGKKIAFLHPKSTQGVLIELSEE